MEGDGGGRDKSKRSLPSYTSIDLEQQLSDIFATNLNPHLTDPDMSTFYATRIGREQKMASTKITPPSIYTIHEMPSKGSSERSKRMSASTALLVLFVLFFACPLLLLLFLILTDHVRFRDSVETLY